MKNNKNELAVVYDNSVNLIDFTLLTPWEVNLLFVVFAKVRNRGDSEILIGYKELMELTKYTRDVDNYVRFGNDIKKAFRNIAKIRIEIDLPNGDWMNTPLLGKVYYLNKTREVSVSVDENFIFLFNNLTANFTKFELVEMTQIKTLNAKILYTILKQYKYIGRVSMTLEDFQKKFNTNYKAKSDFIRKTLQPSLELLNIYFENINIESENTRVKNPIITLTWTPEKRTRNIASRDKKNLQSNVSGSKLPEETSYSQEELLNYVTANTSGLNKDGNDE